MDPLASGADAEYWAALRRGEVVLPRCAGCQRWQWPAVWRCGACGSWEQRWHKVELCGRVYSWTRTWHPFGGLEGFDLPFVSLVVTLDGAGHTRLLGMLEGDQAGLCMGAPVRGRVASTPWQDGTVPALRWHIMAAVTDDA